MIGEGSRDHFDLGRHAVSLEHREEPFGVDRRRLGTQFDLVAIVRPDHRVTRHRIDAIDQQGRVLTTLVVAAPHEYFFCESDHRWFHPLQDADADEILMREIRSHRRGVASRNHPDKYFLVEPAGGARCANSTCELVAIMGCRVTQLLGELRKGREDADPIGDGLAANGLTPENLAGARDLL